MESAYAEESAPAKALQNPLRVIEGRTRIPLTFALCADHRRMQELATQLVDASNHPLIRYRMCAALDALSYLKPDSVERVAYLDAAGLAMFVRHLAHLGARARWIDRFVPSILPEGGDLYAVCMGASWSRPP